APAGVFPIVPYPNPETSSQILVGATPTPTGPPTTTPNVGVLPTNAPDGAKTSGGGSSKNIGAIIGGIFGFLALIALIALLFVAAKRRRDRDNDSLVEAGDGEPHNGGGAGVLGPDGFVGTPGGPNDLTKSPTAGPGGNSDMPALAPVAFGAVVPNRGTGDQGSNEHNTNPHGSLPHSNGPSGAETIASKHKRKESINAEKLQMPQKDQAHDSTENLNINPMLIGKRPVGTNFFGNGSGNHRAPPRRPSHGLLATPITTAGSKTEVVDDKNETSVNHNSMESKTTNNGETTEVVDDRNATSVSHNGMESKTTNNGETTTTTSTTTTTTNTAGHRSGLNDVISSTGGTSMTMNSADSTSNRHQDGTSSEALMSSVSQKNTLMGIAGGAAVATGMAAMMTSTGKKEQSRPTPQIIQHQQASQDIQRTQITLKLSIIRYERSDATQATPFAKPGTLMFSQVEMLDGSPECSIPGSAFSHVRDSSKVTGREAGLPSPVVPGPSAAATSSESEPRERSLRWMKNESQWKREAGMLQHLRSDQYIAELFTLYSLPAFAEYRFVSVMGPFTRTLESYIKVRKGIHPPGRSPTPEEESLALQGPLTTYEIKSLTDSIASALKWSHDHHVVHLCLSPASIFLHELYSEPDGNGGYRMSTHSAYSNRSYGASTTTDSVAPKIERHWKLWNFGHARFVGEAIDLGMDKTPYTSPEILMASRRQQRTSQSTIQTEPQEPNTDTNLTTTVSPDGVVTKTMTSKTVSSKTTTVSSQSSEKLMASATMDMWSLGQIVYEMHTGQPMFSSDEDALVKLSSALEERADAGESDDDKIQKQLQDQFQEIEKVEDADARKAIKGLLEMQHEKRLDHEQLRAIYLDE
ncbi:hypothetical protein BG011_009999, partial [Mortierella polycephala]